MLTIIYFVVGLALIVVGAALIYYGLPKGGVVKAVGARTLVGEVYTFAILISLSAGLAFLINVVAASAGR